MSSRGYSIMLCHTMTVLLEYIPIVHYNFQLPYSGKVWLIDSFRTFGERKFGELIDQPIDY